MQHIHKFTHILILFGILSLSISSCKDKVEDPPSPNEGELITTVKLTFVNLADTLDVRIFTFSDPDGEGGNAPTKTDSIRLDANSSYRLTTQFLDESSSEVDDITLEIKEEANEHLICYTSAGQTLVNPSDKDSNGLALGLEATVETKNNEKSNLNIVLKHQPDIKTGNCDLGETDVEVLFQLEVE